MKKTICILLAAALLLSATACSTTHKDWQEQYDLGVRYLDEGNYEQAVLAFSAAIEIDPNNPEAYMGRAEAYKGLGDLDRALKDYKRARREAKNDDDYEDLADALDELIDELEEIIDNPPPPDDSAPAPKLVRVEIYTDGMLSEHDRLVYDGQGNLVSVFYGVYSSEGEYLYESSVSHAYNEAGQLLRSVYGDTGEAVYAYASDGRLLSATTSDGSWSHTQYNYDERGMLLTAAYETEFGTTTTTYIHNEQGQLVESHSVESHEYGQSESSAYYTYDPSGILTGKTEVWASGTHYTAYTYCNGLTAETMTFDYTAETDLGFRIKAVGGQTLWYIGTMGGTYTVDEQNRVVSASGYEQTVDSTISREIRFYYEDTLENPPAGESQETPPVVENRDWQTDLNNLLSGVAYPPVAKNIAAWSDADLAHAIYSKLNTDYFLSGPENYLSQLGFEGDYQDGFVVLKMEEVRQLTRDAFGRDFPASIDAGYLTASGDEVRFSPSAGESHSIHVQNYKLEGDRITAVGIAVYSNPSETEVKGYFKAVAKVNPDSIFGCTLLSIEKLEGNQSFDKLTARASSVLEGSNAYAASNVLDGRPDTAWVEGVNGVGKNEWILLETADGSALELGAIGFLLGYHKSEDLLYKNGCPAQVLIECAGGYSQTAYCYSYTDLVVLDGNVTTSWVRITILDAQAGSKYTDTCISEISFYGINLS